jgi:hypothetical protein
MARTADAQHALRQRLNDTYGHQPPAYTIRAQWRSALAPKDALRTRPTACSACGQRRALSTPHDVLRWRPTALSAGVQLRSPPPAPNGALRLSPLSRPTSRLAAPPLRPTAFSLVARRPKPIVCPPRSPSPALPCSRPCTRQQRNPSCLSGEFFRGNLVLALYHVHRYIIIRLPLLSCGETMMRTAPRWTCVMVGACGKRGHGPPKELGASSEAHPFRVSTLCARSAHITSDLSSRVSEGSLHEHSRTSDPTGGVGDASVRAEGKGVNR